MKGAGHGRLDFYNRREMMELPQPGGRLITMTKLDEEEPDEGGGEPKVESKYQMTIKRVRGVSRILAAPK